MCWPADRQARRTALTRAGLALLLALISQGAAAFDTCIYVDETGSVLRMNPSQSSATLTRPDTTEIACSITAPPSPGKARQGVCQDQPDWTFDVFSGTTDPDLAEDDILAFRGELWSRKCAFTR